MKRPNEVAIIPGLKKGSFRLADVEDEPAPAPEAWKPIPYKDPGLPPQRLTYFEVELRPDCAAPECKGQHGGCIRALTGGRVALDAIYLCWECGDRHLGPCFEHDLRGGELSRAEFLAEMFEAGIFRNVLELRVLPSGRAVDVLECGHAYAAVPPREHGVRGSLGARRCVKCELGAKPDVPVTRKVDEEDPLRRPKKMPRIVVV